MSVRAELLQRRGYSLSRTADLDDIREIKEHLCYGGQSGRELHSSTRAQQWLRPLARFSEVHWGWGHELCACLTPLAVAFDYARELRLARETTTVMRSYTLPDGRVIRCGHLRTRLTQLGSA